MKKSMVLLFIIMYLLVCGIITGCDFFGSFFDGEKSITLTAPTEGDEWGKGLTQTIEWNTSGLIENVKIELLEGLEYTSIVESVANTGSYEWDVPSTLSDDDYKIKVSDAEFPTLVYSESRAFAIISTSDILITQNSNNISTSSSYDIGITGMGTPNQLTFTITNNGIANLELTGDPKVALSGADSSMFSVISQPSSPIGPSSSSNFTISFNPTSIGLKTATVSISNNIEDEDPFTFTLTSKAFKPGVIVVGYKRAYTDPTYHYDWLLKKYNMDSTLEDFTNWNKDYDYNTNDDRARGVAVDSNNNIYVVGQAYGTSRHDWWIKKFDVNGVEDTTNWNKLFGGGYYEDYAFAVKVDNNDNVYVVGNRRNPANGHRYDWWIKKYDSDGNEDTTNWDKTIVTTGHDYAYAVAIDSNNNVYVAGYKYLSSSHYDWWIKKYNSNGVEDTANWDKLLTGSAGRDYAKSVVIDKNDNVYVIGYKFVSGSKYEWWIKKYDSNGVEDTANWDKTFSTGIYTNAAYAGAIDSNNNLYVVGWRHISGGDYDWWIKKFDNNGNEDTTNWDKTENGGSYTDYAYSVAVDKNDNVYVVGRTYVGNNANWWIKKYDSNGNEDGNWNKTYDSGLTGHDEAYGVVIIE